MTETVTWHGRWIDGEEIDELDRDVDVYTPVKSYSEGIVDLDEPGTAYADKAVLRGSAMVLIFIARSAAIETKTHRHQ